MRKELFLIVALIVLIAVPSFAATSTGKANYVVPSSQAFEDFINDQEYIQHSHDIEKPEKLQYEAGIDLVIYDNDSIELVSESRFNFGSKVTTVGGVVKVKKSLVSIVSGLFK